MGVRLIGPSVLDALGSTERPYSASREVKLASRSATQGTFLLCGSFLPRRRDKQRRLTHAWVDLSHWPNRSDHVHSLALGSALAQLKASCHDIRISRARFRGPTPVIGFASCIPGGTNPLSGMGSDYRRRHRRGGARSGPPRFCPRHRPFRQLDGTDLA